MDSGTYKADKTLYAPVFYFPVVNFCYNPFLLLDLIFSLILWKIIKVNISISTDIFTFSNNITNEIYLHVIKFSMALKTHV